jgi:hypothetical protein
MSNIKRAGRLVGIALALIFALAVATPAIVHAMSIQQYETQSSIEEQLAVIDKTVDRITDAVAKSDPAKASQIRIYFFITPADKSFPQGKVDLEDELAALERVAQKEPGKIDLSQAQVENVILSLVKDRFFKPETATQQRLPALKDSVR